MSTKAAWPRSTLIDMATGRPVDARRRVAETFTARLKAHPGMKIVYRDRGGA